jgi:TPR repeat protein
MTNAVATCGTGGLHTDFEGARGLPVQAPIKIRNLAEFFERKRQARLLRQAERNFARGKNEAGVACLRAVRGAGDIIAACKLGDCYERGIGVIQNFVDAVFWYERAAEQSSLAAMDRLGDIYLSGRVIPIAGIAVTANTSDPVMLGANGLRPNGMSVPQDLVKALYWNTKASEAGSAEAQARLGFQYTAGLGVPANPATAYKWFLASAQQNCASGQLGVAVLLIGGRLGNPDPANAAIWLEKAATQGNVNAKLSLALLLTGNESAPDDLVRGARLLLELAEINQTGAMFHLGQLYQAGRGVASDSTKAEIWLRRAGTRGHTPALLALARLFMEASPAPDYESAAIALGQAAELGDPHAQHALAELYASGKGVPLDPPQVAALAKRAESLSG